MQEGDNAFIVDNHCIFSAGAVGVYLACDHGRIANSDFGGFGTYLIILLSELQLFSK